jgi:hypothetical protein
LAKASRCITTGAATSNKKMKVRVCFLLILLMEEDSKTALFSVERKLYEVKTPENISLSEI